MKRALKCFSGCFLVGLFMFLTAPLSISHADTINLKFSSTVPPKSFVGQQQQWWGNELEKRTNGRVKVQFYWMGSLVEWKDALHGVSSGICDLGNPCSTYNPSEFPLYMVLDMPYNGNDYWSAMRAAIDTVENQQDLKAELEKAGIKFLANWMSGFFHLGVHEHVDSIAQLKGKTFRSFGGARVQWMEYLGINPIFMDYAAIYEALDRGTTNGVELVMILSDAFKHYEVVSDLLLADSGFVLTCGLAMNLKKFNSLPPDIQDILIQLREDYAAHYAEDISKLEESMFEKWRTKHNVNVRKLSPEDDKMAREAGKKAQEYFLNKQESAGHPARKVWAYYTEAREKYENIVKTQGHPWDKK